MRVRGLGGGDNLGFARADAAERDIAADAAAEELGLNEHELLNWVFFVVGLLAFGGWGKNELRAQRRSHLGASVVGA